MTSIETPAVPTGVTFVGILAIVVGVVQLVAGVLLLAFSGDVDGWTQDEAMVVGVVSLVAGVAYVAVGVGLMRGNRAAFAVGALVSAFRAAYDLAYLLFAGVDGVGIGLVFSLVVNATGFVVLYRGRRSFGLA